MRTLTSEKLNTLLKDASKIRNICIVAHVDHGKTTLADSLVASNGIISRRMAGKLRYMDSRKDEQERGITMKSSCISLHHTMSDSEYLVNLIDSPGHVDFSSEVSTAVRLCDGAIVVVDVVEGVCPQTQVALKQAWQESIKPVLVMNKIDRLILEMKLAPLDAYIRITQVLEQVNAVVGQLFSRDVLEKNSKETNTGVKEDGHYEWFDGLEESDDSSIYFSPDQGNVIFASAIDGWGFALDDFAKLFAPKLSIREEILKKALWGDYFYSSKTKSIRKGAQEKARKPLFVQLVLENIWALYETICVDKNKEKLQKIVESLGVKLMARDLRHTDPKVQVQAVCSQWLPIASRVLDMVCRLVPAANQLSDEKVENLMCSQNQSFESYPPEIRNLKNAFLKASSAEDAPVIVFISKMFPVPKAELPNNQPEPLTPEQIAERRELAKLRLAQKEMGEPVESPPENKPDEKPDLTGDTFVAFSRVYSGTLRKGSEILVLGPKHDPSELLSFLSSRNLSANMRLDELWQAISEFKGVGHVHKAIVGDLYLMMGREMQSLPEASAGNVVGIGGLEDFILKSATLSSIVHCPPFSELKLIAVPILRVAIEPAKPSDMPTLMKGLKLLNQADACVQILVQETGEHVLVTAGEVHLERCLDDLRTRYANISINVSEPIIPFRETVVPPPIVDMVNEVIDHQPAKKSASNDSDPDGTISLHTPNRQCLIRIKCCPLPPNVTTFLEDNADLIKASINAANSTLGKMVSSFEACSISTQNSKKIADDVAKFKAQLIDLFKGDSGAWCDASVVENIWSFGPKRCGPNLLINQIEDFDRSVWSSAECSNPLVEYESSFINGFQLATLAGPLCEEPMMGVAFVVTGWEMVEDGTEHAPAGTYGPLSGQILSTVKEACRKSFQAQPQRLMAAMYTCDIQANAEVLGRLYAVLGRRQGRVLCGDMAQGSATFSVQAVLPVVESFKFSEELRKQTSGLANPQLVFSHWEVVDIDPFWTPSTEDEYLHYGEKADTENKAKQYVNSVRRRKGLPVEEKIVQHAEKQRTLSKKK
ncbi:unnamed protein product [Nesidiocoris tenuis]|uniref:Ribosome assembly protein 1 n=1 Tax=Nesidiocoris tenuis TaxID=355587 RepID=A0A6H5HGB7_9HEMI|nr:unnamed protein product [Nesidiocoris tenuis]